MLQALCTAWGSMTAHQGVQECVLPEDTEDGNLPSQTRKSRECNFSQVCTANYSNPCNKASISFQRAELMDAILGSMLFCVRALWQRSAERLCGKGSGCTMPYLCLLITEYCNLPLQSQFSRILILQQVNEVREDWRHKVSAAG